jgi:hypothetical protein
MTALLCVGPSPASSFLARPKSATLGVPSAVSSTFDGLRSRWIICSWCAAWIARASVSISPAASRGGSGVPLSFFARLPPGQNSSEKYGRPSCSPTS